MGQHEDFLKKLPKTAFLRDTNLDQLTSEQAENPNFKSLSVSKTDDIWPIHLGMQLLDLKSGSSYKGFKILCFG